MSCEEYELIPLESAIGGWSDEEIAAQRAARLQTASRFGPISWLVNSTLVNLVAYPSTTTISIEVGEQ